MKRVARFSILTTILFAASGTVATASRVCDDLWFTRNWVMHHAGYCFGSTLGQAQFDSSDCTGHQITLTPAQSAFVTDIQRREAALGCSVNTGRSTLDMPDMPVRNRLERQPVRHIGDNMEGWGCLGYAGPQIALHAAPNVVSTQVGRIDSGDWIGIGGHEAVDGWVYVTTHGPSWSSLRSGGWMQMGQTISCEAEAG